MLSSRARLQEQRHLLLPALTASLLRGQRQYGRLMLNQLLRVLLIWLFYGLLHGSSKAAEVSEPARQQLLLLPKCCYSPCQRRCAWLQHHGIHI